MKNISHTIQFIILATANFIVYIHNESTISLILIIVFLLLAIYFYIILNKDN